MSNYLLYGTKLIENNNTLKEFAKSICNNLDIHFTGDSNYEDFKEESMDMIEEHIKDDISRTDINYEELLYSYRNELGDLLYEIQNNGYDMSILKISFFGNEAQQTFEDLLYKYIWINFDKLVL